jgi:hypothetical protein
VRGRLLVVWTIPICCRLLPTGFNPSKVIEMSEEIDKFALFLHQLQEKVDALTLNKVNSFHFDLLLASSFLIVSFPFVVVYE